MTAKNSCHRLKYLCKQKLPREEHIVAVDIPGHGHTDKIELKDDIYPLLVQKLHQVCQYLFSIQIVIVVTDIRMSNSHGAGDHFNNALSNKK